MTIQAIIFDLDGVIVHTDAFHFQAWKQLCTEEGLHFDHEMNKKLLGVSRMKSLEIILDNNKRTLSEEEKYQWTERKNCIYRQLLQQLNNTSVTPEILPTLLQIKDQYKLAIGSSSKNTREILERIQLTNCFEVIVDGTEIVHSKPDPEVFLKAAAYLNVPPKNCLVVEDAPAGIQAAKSAGMKAISYGFVDPEADMSMDKFSELLDLISVKR